jgi:glutaredoxin
MATVTNPKEVVKVYRMSMSDHECPWGIKAINLLKERGIEFEDIKLRSREEVDAFKTQHRVATTPQVFFGEQRVGGYSELAAQFQLSPEKPDYSYSPVDAGLPQVNGCECVCEQF